MEFEVGDVIRLKDRRKSGQYANRRAIMFFQNATVNGKYRSFYERRKFAKGFFTITAVKELRSNYTLEKTTTLIEVFECLVSKDPTLHDGHHAHW